jgi:predicted RNA-binding protein with PUA-like domain
LNGFIRQGLRRFLNRRRVVARKPVHRGQHTVLHQAKFAANNFAGLPSRMKNFWLVKQEPSSYSWSDFVTEGKTSWTGVRNSAARNNLRRMRKGDEVFFYHSGVEKAVIGIARVVHTAYPDPTATEGDWSTVDLAPIKSLRRPVTLREIKNTPLLKKIPLVRQSRLSVMPVTAGEFRAIVLMAE